jgi:hypothetical protein
MKRIISQLGIVLGAMVTITPSTYAGSIPSGTYGIDYPNHVNILEVKNTKNGQIHIYRCGLST